MKKTTVHLLLALFGPALLAFDTNSPVLAPLPIRTEFLLSSGYLALTPSTPYLSADDQWAMELRITTANTFAVSEKISTELVRQGISSGWQLDRLRGHPANVFVIDGEIQRATLAVRRGWRGGELFASIPVLSTTSAWADRIIESFHSDFDLGTDGRSAIPRDQQFVYLKAGEHEWIRTEAGTGLGDVSLGARLALPPARNAAFAAELILELPTGDEQLLFGSGSIDAAVNLLASRRWKASTVFAATGLTRLGDNSVLGIPDRTILTNSLGYSRVILSGTSVTVQITTTDSPFRGLSWSELGKRFYQYGVGIQHQLDAGPVVHFALIENAVHYENSADFAVQAGLSLTR